MSGSALDSVARLDGLPDGAALVAELTGVCAAVAARYDAMLGLAADDAPPDPAAVPLRLVERANGWIDGRYRALRSEAAIGAYHAVRPRLLSAFAAAAEPDVVVARWEMLLERMSSAINVFRLLEARPALLDLLLDCLILAPPLADELARHPRRLDALIDRSAFALPGSVAGLAAEMTAPAGADYEQALDRIRVVVGEKRFALGMQLVEGAQDPLDIAAALSRVAEAALKVAVSAASEEFALRHGRIRDSELVVLGLGRLGGGALTHASDLDIIYLFTGAHDAESDGARPLGATLYYNRLAQRITAALSVPTAEGALYEVDTRLRPQGGHGPLAVSLDSFARYQAEDAWTWEHMALTRARALTGSEDAREAVEDVVHAVLTGPRDPDRLRADVLAMRAEMARHKPAKGPLDAKLLRGGLVDLEFLVHFLQLRERAGLSPDLGRAVEGLASAGLVASDLAEAQRLLARLLVGTRLLAPDLAPSGTQADAVLARLCGAENVPALLTRLETARRTVAAAWQHAFGATLEIEP